MRTHGHLRREHSVAQAQKVSFVPTQADQTTTFAAKVAPAQPDAQKRQKAISSKTKKPLAVSWVDSVAVERPRKIAKRSEAAAQAPESRSLS